MDSLYIYTGLTEAQFLDLRDAALGNLKSMHGARHQTMIELIDENFKITPFGMQVFERAVKAMVTEKLPAPLVDAEQVNALRFKKYLQKHLGCLDFTTAHAKLIFGLARCPEQSYNVLVDGYGTKTINDLERRSLIAGTPRKYHYYSLTGLAINWLKFYLQEQNQLEISKHRSAK
jgi:hypothetical protein